MDQEVAILVLSSQRIRWSILGLALLAAGAGGAPQIRVTLPGTSVGSDQYGTVQPADVDEIAREMYLRHAVRTKGFLEPLDFEGRYFRLSDGGSAVVLIPAADFRQELKSLLGHRVEVEGYVRRLVDHQGTCQYDRKVVPTSICDNPELPPTPDLTGDAVDWPRVSVTAWYVGDLTTSDRKRDAGRDLIGDVIDVQAAMDKTVRVAGRFCGAGLCGDLGAVPPVPKAWALFDDVTAVWVIGKEPAGKGWRLDPNYRADTARWLEVTGRVERCGATRCLRAKTVALIPRENTDQPGRP
jgi:hypothetical protein